MAQKMSGQEIFQLLARKWEGEPDDKVISIGDWHPGFIRPAIKEFHAVIRLTLGEIRQMADPTYKPDEDLSGYM